MVKSGRSISLESSLWVELENFAKQKNIPDISSAVEYLIKKGLKAER